MIPVTPQPEPEIFDEKVRVPGSRFLRNTPRPNLKQWESHSYWTRILMELHQTYNGICAYSAHWIPPGVGNSTVEHFVPKSIDPNLAYEWRNYRLVCGRLNGRRSIRNIIDPFELTKNWFFLDFPSLLIKPNPDLIELDQKRVAETLAVLKLNDDQAFIDLRGAWLKQYCLHKVNFGYLKGNAPFTAYELERQGLVEEIREIMAYDLDVEVV